MSNQQMTLMQNVDHQQIAVASTEVLNSLFELSYLKQQREIIEAKEEQLKTTIQSWMGDKVVLLNEHGKALVSYKPYNKASFDSTRFKEEQPMMYEQYLKQTICRPFKLI